ncbi:hypothetical protein B0I35DRAFT_473707 [Stachybotrys elegans]|uniref:Uncharacterized protein n=1 Tax=Stachybotrys elegans TaxID=80388 RepID=A0A8K0T488_9HYPO|nr:hypothetical protein B0I35DRAFT_473707 [Stachybotrys elegans]
MAVKDAQKEEGEKAGTATTTTASFDWDADDEWFSGIFGPWDPPDKANSALRVLDEVMPAFEEHIGHSKLGFDKWRRRHQEAMERGKSVYWGFPRLMEDGPHNHGHSYVWNDDAWQKRYFYLARQREKLIGDRLKELGGSWRIGRKLVTKKMLLEQGSVVADDASDDNDTCAHLNATERHTQLCNRWCDPVDTLLERFARNHMCDVEEAKRSFWGDAFNVSPRAEAEEAKKKRDAMTCQVVETLDWAADAAPVKKEK